jgi:hypothetical protein
MLPDPYLFLESHCFGCIFLSALLPSCFRCRIDGRLFMRPQHAWQRGAGGVAGGSNSFGSVDRTRSCARTTQHAGQGIQARIVTKRRRRGPPRCSTQRAGIAPPHAEGDGLSGVTSDRELNAFISGPACSVGGVPVTRAMNPWAMPEAST